MRLPTAHRRSLGRENDPMNPFSGFNQPRLLGRPNTVPVLGIRRKHYLSSRMKKRTTRFFLALLLLSVNPSSAEETDSSADAYRLHINGVSLHLEEDDDTNQENWGVGIQRSFAFSERVFPILEGWDQFWELDVYKDSYSDIAVAAGFGAQRPVIRKLDFGLKVGLVYEKGLEDDAGSPVLPYLFPFVETAFDTSVNLRATLIPPFPPFDIDGSINLQLIVDVP